MSLVELLKHAVQWDSQIFMDSSDWPGNHNHSGLTIWASCLLLAF